jgi:hypothetical protein
MVLARSMLDHSAGVLWRCASATQRQEASAGRGREAFELSATLSAIANRSNLESFLGERGGWLWDTIEEGLGTYLYGFLEDVMRTNSRLYGIRTKEYPIMTGLCANIQRKSVEEQGTRIETRGDRGAPTDPTRAPADPTRGPLRVPFCVVPLDSYFLIDMFSDKFSYRNK